MDPRVTGGLGDDAQIGQIENLVNEWVKEVEALGVEEDFDEEIGGAWEDAQGGGVCLSRK